MFTKHYLIGKTFDNLKQFETLLGSSENRRHLYTSIFQNTPHDIEAKNLLDNWSATLYEKRSREVLGFLKKFDRLLELLCHWSQSKWHSLRDDKEKPAQDLADDDSGGKPHSASQAAANMFQTCTCFAHV